jgi:hypothetical protein
MSKAVTMGKSGTRHGALTSQQHLIRHAACQEAQGNAGDV